MTFPQPIHAKGKSWSALQELGLREPAPVAVNPFNSSNTFAAAEPWQ